MSLIGKRIKKGTIVVRSVFPEHQDRGNNRIIKVGEKCIVCKDSPANADRISVRTIDGQKSAGVAFKNSFKLTAGKLRIEQ